MLKKRKIVLFLWANFLVITMTTLLTSCHTLTRTPTVTAQKIPSGRFIVFAGISGSGKSTLARELSKLIGAKLFLEPEEHEWPEIITKDYGSFSAMTAFRNMRIKNLIDAQKKSHKGQNVVVDSYYDKITSFYLGKPGMEWLISPHDPYFNAALTMTKVDTKYLPNADCIVLLETDIDLWYSFLKNRDRERDNIAGFKENFEAYKSYIEEAVTQLSKQQKIKLVKYKLINTDGKNQAKRLRETLQREKILDS